MSPDLPDLLFDAEARRRLSAVFDIDFDAAAEPKLEAIPAQRLAAVEVLLTGWGAHGVDDAVLAKMPVLSAIHHAGGSVRDLVSSGCWERGIRVSSSSDANAVPVAEYATAMILLAAKQVFRSQVLYRSTRAQIDRETEFPTAGNHGAVVGLVGASRIGRSVVGLLAPYDLELLMSDPFLSEEHARELGMQLVEMADLFSRATVISLHAPLLPSTEGMVDRRLLSLMPSGATLINTARGGLVDHQALVDELSSGRIWAILDTTDPYEPLPPESVLYDLPNVFLTPHMAGAVGNELRRLGDDAVDAALRLHEGAAVPGEVTEESARTMA